MSCVGWNAVRQKDTIDLLERGIKERFPPAISDMFWSLSIKDGLDHYDIWEHLDRFVEFKWRVVLDDSFAPVVSITYLRSAESVRGLGIATILLQPFVEALQQTQNQDAAICLKSWVGFDSFYGNFNGAYTFSKLGFDFYSTDESVSTISTLKTKVGRTLKRIWPGKNLAEVEQEVIDLLDRVIFPWDIANMRVGDLTVGKALLYTCADATYRGVLYPNQLESPGMIQFSKRAAQLRNNP